MQPSPSAPADLYNANLVLCLRVNELLQDGGQQCVESGTRLFRNAVADATSDYAQRGKPKSGSSTTASSGEGFWGEAKRWSIRVQEARSLAFEQQRSLYTSLQEAVTTWGTTVNGSLGQGSAALPFTDAWVAELTKWTQAWPGVGKTK